VAKVLFITEKYHSGPQFGLTNNIYNLIGSWECADYGEYEHLFIDPEPGCIWSSAQVDEALNAKQYDAAIISVYHHLPGYDTAKKLGHKICLFWWDAIVSLGGVKSWSNLTRQIIFDHGKGQEYSNVWSCEVPQDERIFFPDSGIEKDIDVSFVGSIGAPWSDRAKVIEKIKSAGINVWSGGGRGPGYSNLDIKEYAKIHKRSKINLNLSYGHGRPQRKGRTFEIAACKGFMMANNGEMMRGKEGEFFGENSEFISFNDNDLIDKIKHYLSHPDIRDDFSYRMHETYKNNWSPKFFWKKVLGICGVNV
jgi:hypothetical protein